MSVHGPPLATPIELNRLLEAGLGRDPAAVALQRGDRLASLIPNRVELVVHYLAGLRSGLVLTPLNHRSVSPEIAPAPLTQVDDG